MMRDANMSSYTKTGGGGGGGGERECNNYQGILLLSIVMKLFARVVLKGLQVLAQRMILS